MEREKLSLDDFQDEKREIVEKALMSARQSGRVVIVGHDYDNQMFLDDAIDYYPGTDLNDIFATVYPDGTIEYGFVEQV